MDWCLSCLWHCRAWPKFFRPSCSTVCQRITGRGPHTSWAQLKGSPHCPNKKMWERKKQGNKITSSVRQIPKYEQLTPDISQSFSILPSFVPLSCQLTLSILYKVSSICIGFSLCPLWNISFFIINIIFILILFGIFQELIGVQAQLNSELSSSRKRTGSSRLFWTWKGRPCDLLQRPTVLRSTEKLSNQGRTLAKGTSFSSLSFMFLLSLHFSFVHAHYQKLKPGAWWWRWR